MDEYPKRCIEQINDWKEKIRAYENAQSIAVTKSNEYAAQIVNAIVTGEPIVIYGNFANQNYIPQLPQGAAVEVPCMVDANGFKPTVVKDIPPQLIALMRTNLNVQELTVAALLKEDRAHIYHAAMVDPHTAAELDLDQITDLVDELIAAHGQWMPEWLQNKGTI